MNIPESIRSIWLLLFGKRLDKSLVDGDKLIQVWGDIYAGRPYWQTYQTRGLAGQRTEYRYLLNAAKILCSELSGLVFAEEPTIKTDKDIQEVLDKNRFLPNMQGWLDRALALGGGALKWVIKDGEPIIDYLSAANVVPVSYDSRGVTEADFISSVANEGKEYRLVEQHRKTPTGYEIKIKAYEKIGDNEYREVEKERAGVTGGDATVETYLPLFVIWRNPEANNIDAASPLGISIYANAIDTLQQLDIVFDYLSDELETSRRKIILPSSMIKTYFDTATRKSVPYYDKNERVYVAFDDAEKQAMEPVSVDFPLRIEQIRQTIQTLLALLSKQCGLSDGFLSFDGVSMKTATEVISENSRTFRTKKNIENSLSEMIVNFLESLREISGEYDVTTTSMEYSIEWDDSVIEDRNSKATYYNGRYTAGTISLEKAIMEMDDLDEKEAAEMAAAIRANKATIDIDSMFGGTEIATPMAATADTVEAVKLSGIQIESANEIINQVVSGSLTREAGINQLMIFLGLSESQANMVMGKQ